LRRKRRRRKILKKLVKQSAYPWEGSGISRCNAWYDFRKKYPDTNVVVDVFCHDKLKYKKVRLSDVRVNHLKVWVLNANGGHSIVHIPNNLDWEIKIVQNERN
jgi:hypothetical protein